MMTTEPIIESDLMFGAFPEGHCFYIEKSQTYKRIESGVKMVEFLLLHPDAKTNKTAIWMIEAKKSSPNSKTHGKLQESMNEVRKKLNSNLEYSEAQIENIVLELTPHPLDVYVKEICNKFVNALTLFIAIHIKRHSKGDSELSEDFKQVDLSRVRFVFVLVIKDCKEEWLLPIKEALNKALRPTISTWNLLLPSILVLNEDLARKKQLIKSQDNIIA